MRYAILSDLHANKVALQHVIDDIQQNNIDQIICLGDLVGYGPQPLETLSLIRQSASIILAGNHDDAVSKRCPTTYFVDLAKDAIDRHRKSLHQKDLNWLKTLPYTYEFDGACAVHGDLTDPPSFNYVDTEDSARSTFNASTSQLIFVGHTHIPGIFVVGESGAIHKIEPQDFIIEENKRYIVNPGSVGYPRQQNGSCLSSYVVYDTVQHSIRFRFFAFDVSSLLQRGTKKPHWIKYLITAGLALIVSVITAILLNKSNQELLISEKSIVLAPLQKQVRANVKIAPKSDPAELNLSFQSASGETLKSETKTIKKSSAGSFTIPAGAVSAHFKILKQRPEAKTTLLSFDPKAE